MMNRALPSLLRWLLAAMIILPGLSCLFDLFLPLAYHLHYSAFASFLGSFTAGDDYHHYIPLMESMPGWALFGLPLVSGLLYFASAWCLLRRSRYTVTTFGLALAVNLLGWMMIIRSPAYTQVFSARHAWETGVYFSLVALLGAALWQVMRTEKITAARV